MVYLIKLFWYKFIRTILKATPFYLKNATFVVDTAMKRCGLHNRVSKFMTKKFYEIDTWGSILHNLRIGNRLECYITVG